MREIKYRAFIPEIKEMVDVWKINFNTEEIVWGDDNELVWNNYFGGEMKDCDIMQYTGLEDKNGKEIYAGDVVYISGYGNYIVEFPFTILYDGAMENDIGEILGNIYENPELLDTSTS